MIIKEDCGCLSEKDKKAIEQGVAVLAVHSIHLERYFTEAQMEGNRAAAAKLTAKEWSARCNEVARKVGEQNEKALSALEAAGLVLGQFRPAPLTAPYDLWVWCNYDLNGRRLDCVSFSVNDRLPLEQQSEIIKTVRRVLDHCDTVGNSARIKHVAVYDEQKLTEIAERFAEENLGKFIRNGFELGEIVRINPKTNHGYKYAFKRKNAKTRGYRLDTSDLYSLSLENAA